MRGKNKKQRREKGKKICSICSPEINNKKNSITYEFHKQRQWNSDMQG